MKTKAFSNTRRKVLTAFLAAAMAFTVCFTGVASDMKKTALADDSAPTPNRYETEFQSGQHVIDAKVELNKVIGAEGIVMLKNEDEALPIATPAKLSMFGKNSVNPVTSGTGSSGGTSGVNPIYFVQSLENAGYTLNSTLQSFYGNNTASGPARSGHATMGSFSFTGETPQSMYTADVKDSYAEYNDAAIVVFSRGGGEGQDLPRASFANSDATGNASQHPTREQIESGTWTPTGGRGRASDPFEHFMELDDNEEALLDMLQENENFDKIIVVINSSNTIEAGFINDAKYSKIKAAFWAPGGGAYGYDAFGKILKGEINPSGRATTMFSADFTKDPTWNNYSNNRVGNGATATQAQANGNQYTKESDNQIFTVNYGHGAQGFYDLAYEEGIYLGYHYYETRGYTEYIKDGNYDWYNENVVYPFGYGLSYTDFAWEVLEWGADTLAKDTAFNVRVKVTNTGLYPGKDVVQLYYTAPYITGGIEKAHVELGNFAKTGLIQPGKSDIVTISLNASDMASFDTYDLNENEKTVWELDKGNYVLRLGKNAHDAWTNGNADLSKTYNLTEEILYTEDPDTGKPVDTRFPEINAEMKGRTLSRSDWEGTWPTRPLWFDVNDDTTIDPFWAAWYRYQNGSEDWTAEDTSVTPVYLKKGEAELLKSDAWLQRMVLPIKKTPEGDFYPAATAIIDPAWDATAGAGRWYTETVPALNTGAGYTLTNKAPMQLLDLVGVPLGDTKWDTFMSQLTVDQLHAKILGTFRTLAEPGLGVPMMSHSDGPLGISRPWVGDASHHMIDSAVSVTFPTPTLIACTWNVEIAAEQGRLVGDYGLWIKVAGWYAPGANIHRTPFSGRNFEYYSEDAVLSGKIMTAVTVAAAKKGLISFMKHFVLNDQESFRDTNGVATWANEQTMRQLYFKPFEKAIKAVNQVGTENDGIGQPAAVMSSFNRVGPDWAGASYELLTDVVRGEWNMQGIVITDAHTGNGYGCMLGNQMIRAGNNLSLDGSANSIARITNSTEANTPTHLAAMYKMVKEVFWAVLNSSAMLNGLAPANMNNASGHYGTGYAAGGANANGAALIATVKQGQVLTASDGITIADPVKPGASYSQFLYRMPEGLVVNPDGSVTGKVEAAPGTYNFNAGILIDDTAGGAWTVAKPVRFFRIVVERASLEFSGETEVITAPGKTFSLDVSSSVTDSTAGTIAYSVSGAPAGVYISNTGKLYGSVAAMGTYTVNVTANLGGGATTVAPVTIYAGSLTSYLPSEIPSGSAGLAYSASVANAIVGHVPANAANVAYKLEAGSTLPAGLTLNPNGVIVGIPAETVEDHFFAVVADAGIFGTQTASFKISIGSSLIDEAIAVAMEANAKGFLNKAQVDALIDILKNDIDGRGYQTSANVQTIITANTAGFLTNATATTLINQIVDGKGFQTAANVQTIITANTAGFLDNAAAAVLIDAAVANKLTEAQVNTLISKALTDGKLTTADIQKLIDDSIEAGKGCGGSSAAIAALFSLLAMAFAVVIKKQF